MLFQVGKWICKLKYDNVQRLLEQVLMRMRNKFYWDPLSVETTSASASSSLLSSTTLRFEKGTNLVRRGEEQLIWRKETEESIW
ncbi:unnamed protein product [Trifolium pratense]|uniref:Uncharacterized protein n=1 Tax=Trifolium pratense TaxID=57577 RepID=A0ACB0L0N5_TRIPR|nr:unnamed protein product [Trifolium pratense]